MGRIKKAATERHFATLSPAISEFVSEATSSPLHLLPSKLASFPQQWPFPRGDLYHWIPLLDRFDHILELFNKEYALTEGPQTQPFERRILQKGDAEDGMPYPSSSADVAALESAGFTSEGDRELVESIVHFTRILLEHCGNRSLYASSAHVNNLLHTTSLSLLQTCLKLALRLAQRYQVARYKNSHPQAQALLLSIHYCFDLDNLSKIAMPFAKPAAVHAGLATPSKGKEGIKPSQAQLFNPSDLVAIAKDPKSLAARGDLVSINMTYYGQPASETKIPAYEEFSEASPSTPTPIRRTSALGPSRERPSPGERSATMNDISPATPIKSREVDISPPSAAKNFNIPSFKIAGNPAWVVLKEALPKLPKDLHYELLNRVRVSKGLVNPETDSQRLLEIRLLAIANLAYAYGESKFNEKIGIPDSEEPRRFHLAQQLCDLLQPPSASQKALRMETETAVLLTLEALTKSRHKASEVVEALAITVNHGVLYYELRKIIATLSVDELADQALELREAEWRDSIFDLVNSMILPNSQARYGERMVAAGIMGILVEALKLRTKRAERVHEKFLQFLDTFIHSIPTAFQTLAGVRGLEVLADIIQFEVTSALEIATTGEGLPARFKSKVVDYNIPFSKQSNLRQLFKFTAHMFEHNAGTHDRLLRNLIDTPQILGSLQKVIENAHTFGSNVWSAALNIMSSFIHNEPTSYQVISEAGLGESLLESITGDKIPKELPENIVLQESDLPNAVPVVNGKIQYPSVNGILPVGETMCDVPPAFGAICLNESGMQVFQASKALVKFFDIFVSPPHVRALEEESQAAATIGHAFDELSRHHPRLKEQIMMVVLSMVKRVATLCRDMAEYDNVGSRLWEKRISVGEVSISGGKAALRGISSSDLVEPRDNNAALDRSMDDTPVVASAAGEEERERAPAVPYLSACFKFLEGFFHNTGMCALFCEKGGAESLLDLATSPSNPHDLVAFPVYHKIASVLKTMCDSKPHLVLPSLLHRTQIALSALKPFFNNSNANGLFLEATDLSKEHSVISLPDGSSGTTIVKCLAVSHMLSDILGRTMAPPHYPTRHTPQTNPLFTHVNFTDVYVQLVDDLGKLHAACLWENLALHNALPPEMRDKSDPRPFTLRRIDVNGRVELATESRSAENQVSSAAANKTAKSDQEKLSDESFAIKNTKLIRYLLTQTPNGIEALFRSLGQALVPKRNADAAIKQHASVVAARLVKTALWALEYRKFEGMDQASILRYSYYSISAIAQMLLKNSFTMESFNHKEAVTLVLSKFYIAGGFQKLNDFLQSFSDIIADKPSEGERIESSARDGLKTILDFYSNVVQAKSINDAVQSAIIKVSDHKQVDYFNPSQFVLEVREIILPAITKLWHSDAIESIGEHHVKQVIEIMRTILKGDGEDRALKRSDNATRRIDPSKAEFALKNNTGLDTLENKGFPKALAREAIYRCNNHEAQAQEYCTIRQAPYKAPRFPIPEGEERIPSVEQAGDCTVTAESASLERQNSVEMTDAGGQPDEQTLSTVATSDHVDASADDLMSDNDNGDILGQLPVDVGRQDLMEMIGTDRLRTILNMRGMAAPAEEQSSAPPAKDTKQPFVTIEDLDEKRQELRDSLVDRCLEVLSAVPFATFELADLIQAAVAKSGEGANPRADIGSTLVSSLLSLQSEERSKEASVKIVAYAHLVSLILQDRDFFDSTLDELKEYFDSLVAWVTLAPDQKSEDAPWQDMILLIIERVLAEDEQPVSITWEPPSIDNPLAPLPQLEIPEPVVSADLRSALFDALVDTLPKVGKNVSLALSISRVLVILTRRRDLAMRLSQKQVMSRLFLMIRQLAGSVSDKLHTSFMLILRHLIEDEQMIRKIMQTEIKAAFEGGRQARVMDTTTYTRNLYPLVLRNPELFIEVTTDMVELARYDGHPHRAQAIALKKVKPASSEDSEPPKTEGQPSTAATSGDRPTESKAPMVESIDGVMTFLLRELSNFKDVEDTPPGPNVKTPHSSTETSLPSGSSDVTMTDANVPSTPAPVPVPATSEPNKSEKLVFKAEEHPIYVYRCFILQCLAELLGSYNRTKVEFINFSRKPETQPATPSKPRAGTLNYLLNALVPVGTLEHKDDIVHRKRVATSNWATTVLVALCNKTTERRICAQQPAEEDPDLAFVRRFVLEHALRSLKEATVSIEELDMRYSRLLGLGDLFNKMLNNKMDRNHNHPDNEASAYHQIGKLMYEKNVIGALTSAIAEIDLNFPNAKRAVKYMLGPLKLLTELGVVLSQTSDLSSNAPGTTTEEDDISSATSLSDEEEEREQTPDLLRNTTLGMFEPDLDDDESGSEDEEEDDEEMYEDEFDEEMEYDDEPVAEHGDVVSDEDEEADDLGEMSGVPGDNMDVEIIMNDHHDEDSDDSDELEDDSDEEDDDGDDDDDDEDDDGAFTAHLDEVEGDEELVEDEEDDWEEDADLEFEEGVEEHDGGLPHGGPLEHLARVIGGDDRSDTGDQDVMHIDMGDGMGDMGEGEYFEDEMPLEYEDDEEDEEDYENEVVYEPELEEDEDEEGVQWGIGAPPGLPPGAIARVHHNHHHLPLPRGFNDIFGMIDDPFRRNLPEISFDCHSLISTAPTYRSHRNGSTPRGEDDGTNPLLQRGTAGGNGRDRNVNDARHTVARRAFAMPRQADDALIHLQDLMAAVGANPGGGPINVTLDGMALRGLPPMFQIQARNGPPVLEVDPTRPFNPLAPWPQSQRADGHGAIGSEEFQAVQFTMVPTLIRWQEEARILFGDKHHEKATRIINALLRILVPPAMEAKKVADKARAEREAQEAKIREEERQKAEAARVEQEAREKKEREEREAQEAEERVRREQQEREAALSAGMDGVESIIDDDSAANTTTEPVPTESAPAERITTTIRGRELDITTLGIDLEYLEALPEEMREEVIMQQFQDQRNQAAQSGEQPSEISREFLEALPREIQAELLRSEAHERRRRERDEQRRAAQQAGNVAAPQAEDMGNADFMAMLDPALRQAILADTDDVTLGHLPEDLQAEARALMGDRLPRGAQIAAGIRRIVVGEVGRGGDRAGQVAREESRQRRPVIQLLDKPGVATLLRLMFVSLHNKAKSNLHQILSDVCKNTQNRAEVISILLSILQDGTADIGAVERTFAQLSLRAKQPTGSKTPQPSKRSAEQTFAQGTELSPLNIVQQCLATLNALSLDNEKVKAFFLNEHETTMNQKAKSAKKGKGRDSKVGKYPLNALLTLLDRKLITENTGVMETLAALLSRVTQPLILLLRRAKETQESGAQTEEPMAADGQTSAASDVPMVEASTSEPQVTGETSNKSNKPEDKKKRRELTPPEVPDENIRLVVNILAARECPSKTFSDTLDIIKNLSAIPGAKAVFGKELVRQAQDLGQTVVVDLEELSKQIDSAETGTDLQGLALASFSSSGSKQRKLLRVLLALDHLFDPKRMSPGSTSQTSMDPKLKDDVLALLYNSMTFESLWRNLSTCLAAIRRKGNMVNVATILLPLIESFMVVCRNTTLKDAPAMSATTPLAEIVSSPPPESRIEDLFFQFTEDNRKILNELIRNNPKLMSGHLSILAKNSKVLEFDNKRTYFTRKLHHRGEARVPHPSLQLSIRRSDVFLDSFKSLYYKSGDEIKYGKLNIRFHGEEGIDAGGVSREWFGAMARQMFNPAYALFNPVASDRTTFHPNSLSEVNEEHLLFFKFIGRIIGKALYEGRVLDCYFSRAVYRRILGKSVSLKDMESLDLDYYKSLVWILENDITDVTYECFSMDIDRFGVTETVDLIPNGRNIPVTEENKQDYVKHVVEYRLINSVKDQLDNFLQGFYEIIPSELISIFNEQELELLISGLPEIDVDDWKNNTDYNNYQSTSPQIQWFWRAVRSFDKEEKAKLLQFVTGTSKVPLNGFKELEGMNGFARFNIHRDYQPKERLPTSHTCFNQLDLPEYESYEHLRHQLYTAITAGSEYFGFA
ncbi:Hypothetical protein R9X50_00627300 [Acrodontium crateriforme]|uniref:HECT-type E3 ubiquitin transferase n=1 Tax=Acrodontium crateriforme TaxID=150365 RepID=A0AAQ3M810_9PEZI|nr:Hypothetical protein R9X50_00627300 [Acrodontium crateriforme]